MSPLRLAGSSGTENRDLRSTVREMIKPKYLFLPVILGSLLGSGTGLLARQPSNAAFLVMTCDGTPQEQRFLQNQSATWLINGTRALGNTTGQVIYRLPTGNIDLERLHLRMNRVPYHLEFSSDGAHWELLISTAGISPSPAQLTTQSVGFNLAQRTAARTTGYAWFRIRPAAQTSPGTLQLYQLRLDVRGAELPPEYVRPSVSQGLASSAPGPLMLLVGALPVFFVWLRWRASWRLWGGGAALWAFSVAVKLGVALVANQPVNRWLHAALPQTSANLALWCYVGLLTGVFECGIFLVAGPLLKSREWTWRDAFSLGVGFGAIEAMVLAAAAVLSSTQTDAWVAVTWSQALVPAFERLLALAIHIAAVAMILYAFVKRRWRWFWISFAYKSAVDGVAAWLLLSGTSLRSTPWLMEWTCVAPFALLGVLVLLHLKGKWLEPTNADVNGCAPSERGVLSRSA